MRVDFSKDFEKALDRLSGKVYYSVIAAINQVKFEYLVSRGEAYAKKNIDRLRKRYI